MFRSLCIVSSVVSSRSAMSLNVSVSTPISSSAALSIFPSYLPAASSSALRGKRLYGGGFVFESRNASTTEIASPKSSASVIMTNSSLVSSPARNFESRM